MTYPKVSIVVLNYNGKKFLKNCFESLKNQTYSNYEVIMVDNASTDGSVEYVQESFPWINVIRNERNLGFAGGNNVGIKNASGDLIVLLNNDALADTKWLEELAKTILSSAEIGIVGGKIYCSRSDKVWFAGGNFFPSPYKPWLLNVRKGDDQMREVDWITGCAMMFRREVIEKTGLLDDGYFLYFEDVDFCLQAKRAGFKIVYNPNAIVWHEGGGVTKKLGSKKQYIEYQSKFRFIFKNLPLLQIIVTLTLHLVFVTIYNIIVLKKEAPIEKLKALIWNFRHLKETLQVRSLQIKH